MADDLAARLRDNRRWILAKVSRVMPVPCGSCVACCKTMSPMLYPEIGDLPSLYRTVEVFDQYWGGPRQMLARREDGACAYLDDAKGCMIHSTRPSVCRSYSCAEQYALYSRADRRRLQREGKWGPVQEAGERQYRLIEDAKKDSQ